MEKCHRRQLPSRPTFVGHVGGFAFQNLVYNKSVFLLSMSDFKVDDGKQCLRSLEHLLYPICETNLHSTAAVLAQESHQSVTNFGSASGYWTFAVVERFLLDRGMRCTVATVDGDWKLDSLHFLQSHPGLVGIIDTNTLESFVYVSGSWLSGTGHCFDSDVANAVVVHQMWSPLLPFYKNHCAFHITLDNDDWNRYECQPSSCWQVEPVSYEGRSTAVKAQMRLYKKSPIMMSNSHEIVICSPSVAGWSNQTVLNYECMPIDDASRLVSEVLADKLVEHIEQHGKGWSVMAHALFSALQQLGGHVRPSEFSTLSEEERKILANYVEGMTFNER